MTVLNLPQSKPERKKPQTLIEFKTIDGMFIKGILLQRGIYPQHSHQFDHSTLIARGSIIFWKKNMSEAIYYDSPSIVFIKKNISHMIQALENDTLIYCLHNLHGKEMKGVFSLEELAEIAADEFIEMNL